MKHSDEVVGGTVANPQQPEGHLQSLRRERGDLDIEGGEYAVLSLAFTENLGNRNLQQNHRGLA